MKNILTTALALVAFPLTMMGGISFDSHVTEHGEVLVQKLNCDSGSSVVLFYLRATVKNSAAPAVVVEDGCKLTVEADGKTVKLGFGDVCYYASNHKLTVINIKTLEQGCIDQQMFERLLPLMELLAAKISEKGPNALQAKPKT
jgi:BRCT domain type II-containing protein